MTTSTTSSHSSHIHCSVCFNCIPTIRRSTHSALCPSCKKEGHRA